MSCKTEGHHADECPLLRGGVAQVASTAPFQNATPFKITAPFQNAQSGDYCYIFCTYGHRAQHCPILHKYSLVPHTVHCDFCGTSTHSTDKCMAFEALEKRMERTSLKVADNSPPQGGGCRGQGGGYRGGRLDLEWRMRYGIMYQYGSEAPRRSGMRYGLDHLSFHSTLDRLDMFGNRSTCGDQSSNRRIVSSSKSI